MDTPNYESLLPCKYIVSKFDKFLLLGETIMKNFQKESFSDFFDVSYFSGNRWSLSQEIMGYIIKDKRNNIRCCYFSKNNNEVALFPTYVTCNIDRERSIHFCVDPLRKGLLDQASICKEEYIDGKENLEKIFLEWNVSTLLEDVINNSSASFLDVERPDNFNLRRLSDIIYSEGGNC